MMILKSFIKNGRGTAEIVGTALFLVILFFFFSNVFLWHNQAAQGMDQVISDRMNLGVKIEMFFPWGPSVSHSLVFPIYEQREHANEPYQLDLSQTEFNFATGEDSPGKQRLVNGIGFSIQARYDDADNEECYVEAWNYVYGSWSDTGVTVTGQLRWLWGWLSPAAQFMDAGGNVKIRFEDSRRSVDNVSGTLTIPYMDVAAQHIGLQVTSVGGLDTGLSRLWLSTNNGHFYADFEAISLSVPAGGYKTIQFDPNAPPASGPISVTSGPTATVHYCPQAGETVTFKVLTELGNSAACSYTFR